MAFVRSQLWLGLLVALGGCGTPQATQTAVRPAVPGDPGSTVTPMAPPEPYTTPFPPPAPQLAAGAAKVLANPVVVPVFFGRDTLQAGLMTYAKAYLAGSSFAALREYGVGAGQLLSAVALPTPATAMDDSDVRALIEGGITDGTLPAPRPDGQSLYTLFFPVTTALTLSGSKSCVDFAGYHETFTTKSGASVVYAVIARCAKAQSLGSVAATTSHELTEATTDPLINGNHMLAPPYGLWVVASTEEDRLAMPVRIGLMLNGLVLTENATDNESTFGSIGTLGWTSAAKSIRLETSSGRSPPCSGSPAFAAMFQRLFTSPLAAEPAPDSRAACSSSSRFSLRTTACTSLCSSV